MPIDFNPEPGLRRVIFPALLGASLLAPFSFVAAIANAQAPSQAPSQTTVQAAQPDPAAASQPIVITLDEALKRAQSSEPTYAMAVADSKVARLDRSIARAGLLPSATYHNQALYTQPNGLSNQAGQGTGSQPSPIFIANNAVHEYASQAVINEDIGLAQISAVRRADAAAAVATAEMEIARRGLVSTVTGLYYGLAAANKKLAIAERAKAEADDFVKLTSEREQAREAAHADTVKAQLEQQTRERELSDAKIGAGKARLELAVLLFPDPRTEYTINVSENPAPLAARADVNQLAAKNNAELKSALATLQLSSADVLAARGAYLPGLGLNYTYGIDAPQFAVKGPDNVNNLGYSASITLDIPVWDWLATEHKVKQSEIKRDAAKVALTATQRRMVAQLDEAYAEAQAARDQLASLDLSVATAAESLRLTRMRYTGGEATVLEVVDAQSAFITAQNAREDGRVRYEAALSGLQTLTGIK
ncbi:TolC family protein [Telmatobacter sp. DSM 110680]|uniref:TolC family protein n=1 Tax=Telmatobacter sp. DSM 110680 TaxID=3036704 RepID=A0AAU7DHU3_9BACT